MKEQNKEGSVIMRVNHHIGNEELLLETAERKYYRNSTNTAVGVVDIYTKDPFEIEAGNTILRRIAFESEEEFDNYVEKLREGIDPYEGYTNQEIKEETD